MDRDTRKVHAPDGKILYKHNVGGPTAGGLVSYAAGSKQHVAVVSGFVGGYHNQMAPEIGVASRPSPSSR